MGHLQQALVDNELSRALMLISGIEIPAIWRAYEEQMVHYCSLLKNFIHRAKEEVKQLIHHLAAGDQDAARVLTHQIRGFAGFVGAQRVASLIGEVDRGLRTGIDVVANTENGHELPKFLRENPWTLPSSTC